GGILRLPGNRYHQRSVGGWADVIELNVIATAGCVGRGRGYLAVRRIAIVDQPGFGLSVIGGIGHGTSHTIGLKVVCGEVEPYTVYQQIVGSGRDVVQAKVHWIEPGNRADEALHEQTVAVVQ